MSSTSLELREQRASVIKQSRELLTSVEAESRQMSEEEEARWNGLMQESDQLAEQIKQAERREYQDKAEAELKTSQRRIQLPSVTAQKSFDRRQYSQAVRAWFKYGISRNVSAHEREAASVCGIDLASNELELRSLTTGGSSGEDDLLPTDFYSQLQVALKTYGSVFNVARKFPTNHGRDIDIPIADDVTTAAVITSEGDDYDLADPTFTKATLKATKWTTAVAVSREMLDDSAVNLESYLAGELGKRLARGFEPKLSTGTGTGQPQGVVTGSVQGCDDETMTYAGFVTMEHAIDAAYRNGAIWMMADGTVALVKQLLDNADRPLINSATEGIAGSVPVSRLLGYPVVVNNNMASFAVGNKAILFGAIGSEYWVRTCGGVTIQRLNELGALKGLVYFAADYRLDGRYVSGVNAVVHWAPESGS